MTRLLAVTVAAVLTLGAACGDGGSDAGRGGDPAGVTTTSAPSTTTSAPTTTAGGAAMCSAGEAGKPGSQEGLPDAVADMRTKIIAAALVCDYSTLEELALAGDSTFTFSFGGGTSPAAHWRELEEAPGGPDPMRYLVGLLNRPYRLQDIPDGEDQYVWPSAFAYDSWEEVPEADKEALKPLYTEDDFEGFEQFGSYAGYRVGITADGDWRFFVAGD